MAQDTRGRLAVLGLGYVGLPLAMRAVEVGYDVVGFDVDKPGSTGSSAGDPSSTTSPTTTSRTPWPAAGSARPADATRTRRVRHRRRLGPDTAARRSARPELHRGRGADRRSARPARMLRDPRVHDLPGYDGGGLRPAAGAVGRVDAPARDFHVGYSPERIDPSNTTWNFVNTPEDRVRGRRGVADRGRGLLREPRRHRRAGEDHHARPSSRSCSRTPSGTSTSPSSTSSRCTATSSASTSGR